MDSRLSLVLSHKSFCHVYTSIFGSYNKFLALNKPYTDKLLAAFAHFGRFSRMSHIQHNFYATQCTHILRGNFCTHWVPKKSIFPFRLTFRHMQHHSVRVYCMCSRENFHTNQRSKEANIFFAIHFVENFQHLTCKKNCEKVSNV